MTDLAATLREICENPEQDGARLRYADLLLDDGQAERAEFCRVQCELARVDMSVWQDADPSSDICWGCWIKATGNESSFKASVKQFGCKCSGRVTKLRRREQGLKEQNGAKWSCFRPDGEVVRWNGLYQTHLSLDRGHAPPIIGWEWSRGFIQAVTCSWSDWQRHADNLVWTPPRKCQDCNGVGAERDGDEDNGPSYTKISCFTCRGEGEVPGATRPCPRYAQTGIPCGREGPALSVCDLCSGSGRIPMPFVETMQPITEVTLTTWPSNVVVFQGGGIEEAHLKWLHSRWSSIKTWNLPDENAAQRAVATEGNLT